jgi:uncharacterized protein (DUF1330 family)
MILDIRGEVMKTKYMVALAIVGSFALGAAAVHGLHAQARPIAYVVAQVNVTDKDAYAKEFLPIAVKAIEDAGGKFIVRGGKTVSFTGAQPDNRIVLFHFENMDKAQAWWDSPGRNNSQPIGDKYATFRVFAVEGVSP